MLRICLHTAAQGQAPYVAVALSSKACYHQGLALVVTQWPLKQPGDSCIPGIIAILRLGGRAMEIAYFEL